MSNVYNLSEYDSVVHDYMEALRNVDKQGNQARFRDNIRRVGRVIGYEVSKHLSYVSQTITTPLEQHHQRVLSDDLVLITLLRAGLPLHDGILDIFPEAENGFISAYRKHEGDTFKIELQYVACPDLTNKVVIINDPMLATGSSMLAAWEVLLGYGKPSRVIIASVIASEQGVATLQEQAPGPFELWVGAIDPVLNDKKYIVPGLGDAGDLAFGEKIQQ